MSQSPLIAVGFDLGGTACKLGLFDVETGNLLEHTASPVKDGKRPGVDLFNQLCDAAEGLLRGRGLRPEQVVSICVASAGILGPEAAREPAEFDRIVFSPNIPGMNGFNIREGLQQRFPTAITFLENDAKAHGWAEWFHGAGRQPGVHVLVGFTLGTGLGGFLVIDGKMSRPGELGHIRIDTSKNAPFCGCGVRGCAEAFVSKVAIRRIGGEVLIKFPNSKLREIGKSPEGYDPLPIAKAAESGDEGCRHVYDLVGRSLGKLIWNLKRVCRPDVVICSGNIARSLPLMLPGIQAVLEEDRLLPRQPVVQATSLGPGQAGIIGAGALAVHGYRDRPPS
ncbi:MAG: ROK family protein [Planctomycetes bacterium]|nr:ROK family protein [Planctomycetota bacterium]